MGVHTIYSIFVDRMNTFTASQSLKLILQFKKKLIPFSLVSGRQESLVFYNYLLQ